MVIEVKEVKVNDLELFDIPRYNEKLSSWVKSLPSNVFTAGYLHPTQEGQMCGLGIMASFFDYNFPESSAGGLHPLIEFLKRKIGYEKWERFYANDNFHYCVFDAICLGEGQFAAKQYLVQCLESAGL